MSDSIYTLYADITKKNKIKNIVDFDDVRHFLRNWVFYKEYLYASNGHYTIRFPADYIKGTGKPKNDMVSVPHNVIIAAQDILRPGESIYIDYIESGWRLKNGVIMPHAQDEWNTSTVEHIAAFFEKEFPFYYALNYKYVTDMVNAMGKTVQKKTKNQAQYTKIEVQEKDGKPDPSGHCKLSTGRNEAVIMPCRI